MALEMLVCLSSGLRCSLKSSFDLSYVLFVTAFALYHIYNGFRVSVNEMINRSCWAGRMKWVGVESGSYVFAC